MKLLIVQVWNKQLTILTNSYNFKANVFALSVTISPYDQHLTASHLSF